jgi:hypothetical protein
VSDLAYVVADRCSTMIGSLVECVYAKSWHQRSDDSDMFYTIPLATVQVNGDGMSTDIQTWNLS